MFFDQNRIVQEIAEKSPVELQLVQLSDKSSRLSLRPSGVEAGRGFVISFAATDGLLVSTLTMESFAGSLLAEMRLNQMRYLSHWSARWKELIDLGSTVMCQIGSEKMSEPNFELATWSSLLIGATTPTNLLSNHDDIFKACQKFVDLVLAIAPVDDLVENLGDYEGESSRVNVNKYERSRRNRQICLDTFGHSCKVCEFNFEVKYGELGRGFAEVHHVEPVSLMEGPRRLDPLKDLVVLCSNCHSMAHRESPPVTPERLIRLIQSLAQ